MSRDDLGDILNGIRQQESDRLAAREDQRREDARKAGYPEPPARRVVSRGGR